MQRYIVHFRGRVQGVGFRYTTCQIARRYRVAGFVQNLPDGRVLMTAEGESKELDGLIADLLDHMGGFVHDHELERGEATGEFGEPGRGVLSVRH